MGAAAEGEAPAHESSGAARKLALRVATARAARAVRDAVRSAVEDEGLDRARACGVLEVLARSNGALPDEVQREVLAVLREDACARAERDFVERIEGDEAAVLTPWAHAAWEAGGETAVLEVCARVWSLVRPRGRAVALVVDCVRVTPHEPLRVALYLALIEHSADPRAALADERVLSDESRSRVLAALAARRA